MGLEQQLRGARVYFDANIFIYLLEGFEALSRQLSIIRKLLATDDMQVFTGELTLCEVLVPAFREGNQERVSHYRQFLEESGAFGLLPMTRETFVRAGYIRAAYGHKTPDALHLAAAMEAGCGAFLTNDRRLRAPKTIRVLDITAG